MSVSAGIMKSANANGTDVTVRVGTVKGSTTAANHNCGIIRRNVTEVNDIRAAAVGRSVVVETGGIKNTNAMRIKATNVNV